MQDTSTLEVPRPSTAKLVGNNINKTFLRTSNVSKTFPPTFPDYGNINK
jgi:hypothetical protein